jgi:DNA-binding transcriptional regulator YiaG
MWDTLSPTGEGCISDFGARGHRTREIPPPPRPLKPAEIRRIRLALNASQALFARFLNVSLNTVESWEQGVRQPDQAALKLLTIAKKHPQAVLSA